jgi:hypothetical protein
MALALASLGYVTALYRDSDTTLPTSTAALLERASVPVFEYGDGLNTEQIIFSTASDALVQELLVYAREERGDDAIDNNLHIRIPDLDIQLIRDDFATWEFLTEMSGEQLRVAIAEVAGRKKWFKDQRIGRGLAPIVWRIAAANPRSSLAITLDKVEAWLYA